MNQTSVRRFHYAWIVAAVTFFVLLIGAGIRSAPGVFMVPVEQEFGWSRSAISFALSVNLLLYGLVGPFAAAVMDRFGIRRVTLTALFLLVLGTSLTTWMQSSWQLTLLWGVVPPTVKLTTNLFGQQRSGVVFGWILAAHQLGASVAAYGGGVVYTLLNSYFFMFLAAGIFCLLASLMVMRIGKSAPASLAGQNM